MGMDPLTIGLGVSAASGIYNAISGSKAQHAAQGVADKNFGLQQQAFDAQQQQYGDLKNMIMPYLNGSGFNTGQDGMMQMMRGDTSGGMIDSIRKLSNQDLGDQLSAQRGSVGSLGQRFGTAELGNEARLRERAVTGLNNQYGQLGLQLQNMDQNKTLGLLSLLAGARPGGQVPQQQYVPPQGGGFGDALGNIGNMAMLYPFLKGMGGGSADMSPGGGYTFPGGVGMGSGGGIPTSLFPRY